MARYLRIAMKTVVLTGLFLACVALLSGPVYSQGGSKEKLQQKKKQLEQEIRTTMEMLDKTQKSKQLSVNQVKILRRQIQTREKLIRAINDELFDMEVQLTWEKQQIDRLQSQLQQLKSEYARMIRHAWRTMNGRSKLMFIFSSKDFNQAYQRMKYYRQYAAYRREQAAKIEDSRQKIDRHRLELETLKVQKLELIDSKTHEKKKLDQERLEQDKAVKDFTSREKKLMATLKTKQDAAKRLNSEIEKAINEEIRAAQAREKRQAAGSSKSATGVSGSKKGASTGSVLALTPSEQKLSSSFSANYGKLPWPCDRGIISESFGEHAHPLLKNVKVKNNGVDIMTERGASVRSVFSGKVSKVMSFQQLNNVVIIRHGEYLTVYANMASVSVREGEEVKARQVIGVIADPADEQRPELHFELWKGKTILNPENWLAGR